MKIKFLILSLAFLSALAACSAQQAQTLKDVEVIVTSIDNLS